MEEIILKIRGVHFVAEKAVLCEYSDYFRAIFSGNYIETELKEINIDMLEPSIMSIILKYMNSGTIDTSDHSLSTINEIAIAADYLQITDLNKQIEHSLYNMEVCESNWVEIMIIAENLSYSKVEQLTGAFGLYSFKSMQPEHIPTLDRLAWYLSHPYLDNENEFDVFNFGLKWILHNKTEANALLIILGCLDYTRITQKYMQEIKSCVCKFKNKLTSKVVDCFLELTNNGLKISEVILNEQKSILCKKFTEKEWTEAVDIVKQSKSRCLIYTPVMLMYDFNSDESFPYNFNTFNPENGFKKWFKVPKTVYRWNVTSWGLWRLVFLYDEKLNENPHVRRGRVHVWDTLRKEWTVHDVHLPSLKYQCGLTVVNDSLYIIGGVDDDGGSVSQRVIVYDLKKKRHREIAQLPEDYVAAVCSYENTLYVALGNTIYCYEDSCNLGSWSVVMETEMIIGAFTSYKGYIYCSDYENTPLYRFRPHVDDKLELVSHFSSYPFALINTRNSLLAVVYPAQVAHLLVVEKYLEENKNTISEVIYKDENNSLSLEVSEGYCALAMELPPLCKELSNYHNKYLSSFNYLKKSQTHYSIINFAISIFILLFVLMFSLSF